MSPFPTRGGRPSKRVLNRLLIALLFASLCIPAALALPTWYDVGAYVVYDSQVDWIITSTTSEANTRWHVNIDLDPNYPLLVEPYYSNASLVIQMVQRVAFSATWRVTELHDVLVVVRSYTHEVRTYSDTVEIARFEIKNAAWQHEVDGSYPDLFIGFDPEYLRSNPTFRIGNMEYINLGIEEVETPWGVRRAYHLVGKSGDASQNQTWEKWCDVVSGVTLKSDLRHYRGNFGNLQYYERYREVLVIREASFDVTRFEAEPWYQFNFYGFRLWMILAVVGAVAAYLVVKRLRTKPIEF
ncbi:MAG: hypothetical protein JTT11_03180 [Candidatus Brockarchaeota archaeon]|nr:hypothetical protein [Candidatus Brockarchaeota archaeon]